MSQKSCQATPNASNGSLLSPSSSLSQEDDNALARPFKKVKTHLSICSKSSTIIDLDSPDQDASTVANDSSDIEVVEVDPEKDLGTFVDYFQTALEFMTCVAEALKKVWRSPIYSFFKSDGVSIQYHNGRMCHFFPCAAWKCKTAVGGVRRYQDSKDKSSTANLKHHAIRCFGEEAVQNTTKGKAGVTQSASIFSIFAHQGQPPVRHSHRTHTNTEVR